MILRPAPFALLCLALFCWAVSPLAQAGEDFFRLPPEQRQQIRQQMRDHWQKCAPEEGGGKGGGKERWQQFAPEEKRRLRADMAAHSPGVATEDRLSWPPRHHRRPPSAAESE